MKKFLLKKFLVVFLQVEKIVDCKLENGEEFYEVKWVDYEETTWEPIKNLQACEDALDGFEISQIF